MMEIQGAIGIIQLSKLNMVINLQRNNKENIWKIIKNINGITKRESPANSFDTADALVFFVENENIAKKCRLALNKQNFNTKILPEAYSWHFAGTWNHMPTLVEANGKDLMNTLSISHQILSRAISLEKSIKQNKNDPEKIASILSDTINQ